MKLLLILTVLSLIAFGVKGAETWYSENFGGSVEVEYNRYDVDKDNDIDMDDINATVSALGLEGPRNEDVNNDFVVDYLDIGGVCFWYPWSLE